MTTQLHPVVNWSLLETEPILQLFAEFSLTFPGPDELGRAGCGSASPSHYHQPRVSVNDQLVEEVELHTGQVLDANPS